jgi:hypothetical protein
MTDARTRYVAFDGCQVAVCSEIPEILAALERSFRGMLEPEAGDVVGRLCAGCAPRGYFLRWDQDHVKTASLDHLLFYLNYEVVLRLIGARPDLVWLHAGAAALQGRAVLVSGVSGRGKSTIITSLCALGWHFLSDDVAPLDPNFQTVFPFPQTPMYRPHAGKLLPPSRLQEVRKVEAAINPAGVCRTAVPVAALILPSYAAGQPAALSACSSSSAALELLQNCLNFPVHGARAFHSLCDLVKAVPTLRLSFSSGTDAAQLLAQVFLFQ